MKKILILNLLTLTSFAVENIDKTEEISKIVGQNVYEPNYFSMILGLFLVVGMIYVTGFFYQKLTKANSFNQNYSQNKVQIVSTTNIGQGRNLHVVKFGDDVFLLGATQNNITYLKDVKLIDVNTNKDAKNDK